MKKEYYIILIKKGNGSIEPKAMALKENENIFNHFTNDTINAIKCESVAAARKQFKELKEVFLNIEKNSLYW